MSYNNAVLLLLNIYATLSQKKLLTTNAFVYKKIPNKIQPVHLLFIKKKVFSKF